MNKMSKFQSYSRFLMWFMALLLSALAAGCGGGGGGGRDPILGLNLPALVSIAVAPITPSIPITGTKQFTATATYSDGSSRDVTAASTWAPGNPVVALVGPATGLANGLSGGTSLITATFGGMSDSTTLTVTTAPHVSLVVTPTPATIPILGSQQYTAIETFSDGTTFDRTVTSPAGTTVWSSSIPAKATVGAATGLATGVTATLPGAPVTITASFTPVGGAPIPSTPAFLFVSTAKVLSVLVTPVTAKIVVGGKQQYTATAFWDDLTSSDVTTNAGTTWTSITPAKATFAAGPPTGIATGVAAGTSNITASFSGKTSPLFPVLNGAQLTVTLATVTSISVTPAAPTIAVGGTYKYTATAFWSDLTSSDVTAAATWSTDGVNFARATVCTSTLPATCVGPLGPEFGKATGVTDTTVTLPTGPVLITAKYTDPVSLVVTTSPTFPATGGASLNVTPALVPVCGLAGAPPCLGMAGTYGIIARDKITISAAVTASHIYGDVALTLPASTMASLVGFGPYGGLVPCLTSPQVTGSINTPDNCLLTTLPLLAPQPYTDLHAAYLDLMARPVTGPLGAATVLTLAPAAQATPVLVLPSGGTFAAGQDLTGWILGPGTYTSIGDYGLSATLGPLVLDAGGNPDAVFIIRSTAATAGLSSTTGSVVLQGKAQAKNVFWVMPGAPSIGAGASTFFQGTVVAGAATTLGTFTIVQGRILAGALGLAAGAVVLSDTNTISVPQ